MQTEHYKGIIKDSTLRKILNGKDMKITGRIDDNRIKFLDGRREQGKKKFEGILEVIKGREA